MFTDNNRICENISLGKEAVNYAEEWAPHCATRSHSKLDWFVILTMRAKESEERTKVKRIMQINDRKERVKKLKSVMLDKEFFKTATQCDPTLGNFEGQRERLAKNAKLFRYGNCGERSALCVEYLIRNGPSQNERPIAWCILDKKYKTWWTPKGGDHAFCIYDIELPFNVETAKKWGMYATLIDGWTGDVYPVKYLESWLPKGERSVFQWAIRRLIYMYDGHIIQVELIA